MGFPNGTVLIDSLQGANANPIGAPWAGPTENGKGQMLIVSAQAAGQAPFSACSYIPGITGATDVEAWMTVVTLPTGGNGVYVDCRIQNPGNAVTEALYRWVWINGTGFALSSLLAHGFTQVGAGFNIHTLAANEQLGVNITGNVISGYYGIGSVFTLVNAYTDSTISGIGTIGFGCDDTTTRMINFGGGSILPLAREQIELNAVRTASTW